ncbi:MAG: hypothetical protein PF795_01290, partial [Kiritimatiellae bacterium]|nr:hypothetical protein [Kiritimatiellia bacterium]
YAHKPPQLFWINQLFAQYNGDTVTTFTTRIPSLLGAILSLYVTSRFAAALFGGFAPWTAPLLLDGLEHADLCCGYRQTRQDHLSKIIASRIGNSIRNRALRSTIIDTGCSLKAFRKEALTGIRLYQGMHRFLPDLCRLHNQAVITQIPVHHRPRKGGKSKYSNWGRFLKTVPDLFAVRWMTQRHQDYSVTEE